MISLSKIEKEIKKIEQDVTNCKRCDLWKTRNNPVAGEGSVTTKVMFIGEAPGYNEDMQGRPFVGKAGKILDELLYSVGFERKEIYIANILKCRPLKNRNPLRKEIKACTSYLDKQIMTMKPKVIVTLGNFASSYVLEKFGFQAERIGKIHGKIFHIKNLLFDTRIIPSYHPAAAVYNPNLKNALMKDFKSIIEAI
ncbi:MAG: uracil-DNA glycosylase [Thermoplasmatales archaeon]|nr:MAG: uracil-DNA glycosylase [Thermoplasmatales archaeon]